MTEQNGADIRAIKEKWAQPPAHMVSKLPKGKKDSAAKSSCAVCGGYHETNWVHLDYMGHADVTLALLDVDPMWSWEPTALDEVGAPVIIRKGDRLVMWGKLTVLGKSVLAVGTCEASKGDPEKELIGDLLRNGAMRFGIGTALWSKGDHGADPAGSGASGGYEDRPARGRTNGSPQRANGSGGQSRPTQPAQRPATDRPAEAPAPAAGADALPDELTLRIAALPDDLHGAMNEMLGQRGLLAGPYTAQKLKLVEQLVAAQERTAATRATLMVDPERWSALRDVVGHLDGQLLDLLRARAAEAGIDIDRPGTDAAADRLETLLDDVLATGEEAMEPF
jgi:hypothetical protein